MRFEKSSLNCNWGILWIIKNKFCKSSIMSYHTSKDILDFSQDGKLRTNWLWTLLWIIQCTQSVMSSAQFLRNYLSFSLSLSSSLIMSPSSNPVCLSVAFSTLVLDRCQFPKKISIIIHTRAPKTIIGLPNAKLVKKFTTP